MQKIMYPCLCGGNLSVKKERITRSEINCGILEVLYCNGCGEEYLSDKSLKMVESKLKENNLWGRK